MGAGEAWFFHGSACQVYIWDQRAPVNRVCGQRVAIINHVSQIDSLVEVN